MKRIDPPGGRYLALWANQLQELEPRYSNQTRLEGVTNDEVLRAFNVMLSTNGVEYVKAHMMELTAPFNAVRYREELLSNELRWMDALVRLHRGARKITVRTNQGAVYEFPNAEAAAELFDALSKRLGFDYSANRHWYGNKS